MTTKKSEDSASHGHIIDVHSHALLPRGIDALRQAPGVPREIATAPLPPWSVEKHLAMMDAHGIQACVLSFPGATAFLKGQPARDLARAMNEDFAEIIARHPRRFGAFAILPVDDMNSANEEMSYALDVLKLDGVVCTTNIGGLYLGDPLFDAWFAEMNRRKAALFVHPTSPRGLDQCSLCINPSLLEFPFDTTRMVTNMVLSGAKKRFADVNMITAHAGGTIPFLASRIGILEPQFGAGPGRAILSADEIFEALRTFYYELTASTAPASLDAIRHLVPASHLMLGFDFPMMSPTAIAPSIEQFERYSALTADERRLIVQGTASTLFAALASRIAQG